MDDAGDGKCTPFGDVIVVDFEPNEPFGRLPSFFAQLYPNDVPMHAVTLDPVGNENNVSVDKIGRECYFTEGWDFFGKFYGMERGAWVFMVYVRTGCFEITIKDRKWVDWIYPPIPEPLEGGFGSGGVNQGDSEQQLLIGNNVLFPFSVVKFVKFEEYTGDVMTLPSEFYNKALIDPEAEIHIVDEFGKRWPCIFRRRYGDQANRCFVCKGWARFCRRKGLKQGQKIKFAVTYPKSNQLHYIPVV